MWLHRAERANRIPLHHQVCDQLRTAVAGLAPGDLLPSEAVLQAQTGVSRTTVRQALGLLATEGLIVRERGRGTRVSLLRREQELASLTGFAEDMLVAGLEPRALLRSVTRIAADQRVADRLQVPFGTTVVRIERLRLVGTRPTLFDVSFLPLEIGNVVASGDLEARPIFELLEQDCGIHLRDATCRVLARLPTQRVAAELLMDPALPVLAMERTTYSHNGQAVDFEDLFYRGDSMSYTVRVKRSEQNPTGRALSERSHSAERSDPH